MKTMDAIVLPASINLFCAILFL